MDEKELLKVLEPGDLLYFGEMIKFAVVDAMTKIYYSDGRVELASITCSNGDWNGIEFKNKNLKDQSALTDFTSIEHEHIIKPIQICKDCVVASTCKRSLQLVECYYLKCKKDSVI